MSWKRRKYRKGELWRRDGTQPLPIRLLKKPIINKLLSRLCEEAGVTVRRGPHNRQIIHLQDILPLLRYLAESYRPPHNLMGFDRISLLVWLSGLEKELELFEGKKVAKEKSGYGRRMEIEIRRISKLHQPARTIAAVELMQRIEEAQSVVQAMDGYLKKEYGEVYKPRYEKGLEWWRELEELSEIMRPKRGSLVAPPSGSL